MPPTTTRPVRTLLTNARFVDFQTVPPAVQKAAITRLATLPPNMVNRLPDDAEVLRWGLVSAVQYLERKGYFAASRAIEDWGVAVVGLPEDADPSAAIHGFLV